MAHVLVDLVLIPLTLPLVLAWLAAARVLSLLAPLAVVPLLVARHHLRWACPFVGTMFAARGAWRGRALQLGLEWAYTVNVVRRFLTLPLRRELPSLYIAGFPK